MKSRNVQQEAEMRNTDKDEWTEVSVICCIMMGAIFLLMVVFLVALVFVV